MLQVEISNYNISTSFSINVILRPTFRPLHEYFPEIFDNLVKDIKSSSIAALKFGIDKAISLVIINGM
jgi:hypothetical protein